ncbi:homoserine O-acetyltransferase [Saprolegnia parasitica CBS 223.65]|uniref:Homoserine O-acetyltransferase n=1 Tax=Saprolegnia parasitica (strain CBS 223.65) TaxID=695850 RepID=A0A067CH15_SAPPC|nr:homoserine O-acetyltransferase [Saprolegnia parasitica CBS 223.65]KDO25831.1 homoserine O-acetyltransferase [Saprolegnia parasitica CBS 223.65]|eukprot:XP_012203395.1 homoserine O-acetyltransferase [Saprolegnia parasitica CBS 223.65]
MWRRSLPIASSARRRWLSTHMSRNKGVAKLPGLDMTLGGSLSEVSVTYEQWGDQTLPDERTIVIFPSFSHSSHVASNLDDPRPGWWENMVGPGKAINTSVFRVICASVLGSPYGSTSPLSINPATGTHYRASFPQITPADMATVHCMLLDHLGVQKPHAVVGGSMGGMQAVQFASLFPDRLERLVALSCTSQTTPGTVAFRRVQRLAILSDPAYNDGNYEFGVGLAGMKVARELGMTCYRSREEFDTRFDWQPSGPRHFKELTFDVESYMDYQANKFARVFDPNCYLLLSKAMDLTNLGHGYQNLAEGVGRIEAETLIIGVKQDLLVPLNEQKTIVDILESYETPATLSVIDSKYGHDAMFHPQMQSVVFSPIISDFLERDLHTLEHEHQRYSSL